MEQRIAIRRRFGLSGEYHSLKVLSMSAGNLSFGIGFYFTYFYIESKLWSFLLSFIMYAATLYLWRKIRAYLFYRFEGSRVVRYVNRFIFWSIPPLILFGLYKKLDNLPMVLIIGVLWGVGIAIYVTSQYLYAKNINIERVKGRFAGLKRSCFVWL
jgi:hypothetical protein